MIQRKISIHLQSTIVVETVDKRTLVQRQPALAVKKCPLINSVEKVQSRGSLLLLA